jgi:hypothetical protein
MTATPAIDVERAIRLSLWIGIAGAIVGVIGLFVDARASLQVYLAAAIGWTSVPIGCIPILAMMALIGGAWRNELAAPVLAAIRTIPIAALLFLPVLIGLYLSMGAERMGRRDVVPSGLPQPLVLHGTLRPVFRALDRACDANPA